MVRANRELPEESVVGRCPQGSTYTFFARILGVLNSCQCSVSARSFWLESQESCYFPCCHFPAWCQGRMPWSHQVEQTWKWPPSPLSCLGQADSHLGPEWQCKLASPLHTLSSNSLQLHWVQALDSGRTIQGLSLRPFHLKGGNCSDSKLNMTNPQIWGLRAPPLSATTTTTWLIWNSLYVLHCSKHGWSLKHLIITTSHQVSSHNSPNYRCELEKEVATHSSILAWNIPWTEEPGRLQSTGSQTVGHDWATSLTGLPWWISGKEPTCQCRTRRFYCWVGKIPWRRKWQPTPVFLPGKSHGQRSLAGYRPWGHKRFRHDLATNQQQ